MDIRIEKEHKLSSKELPVKICDLLLELEKELHIDAEWREDYLTIDFKSTGGITKGMVGTLRFDDVKVVLELDLPFGLKPMKKWVEDTIEEYISEHMS